jgi:hypothetical protein
MLRNTRSKPMNTLFHDYDYIQFLSLDTFLKRQRNLKSMFGALSVK